MVRRRRLFPDATIETATYGPVDFVSDEAYLQAVLAAAQTQALAGGVLTVVVHRHPTDLPQEMVTTSAVIEWKDRTDAKSHPEPTTDPTPAVVPEEPVEVREPVAVGAVDDIGDGLDEATLPDEDLASVPETLR